MGAKMDLKKPTGRRRRPMKILPHPAPRQIPSNFRQILASGPSPPVKFRQIPAARRAPSNSVKFRQIPDPARAPTIPPLHAARTPVAAAPGLSLCRVSREAAEGEARGDRALRVYTPNERNISGYQYFRREIAIFGTLVLALKWYRYVNVDCVVRRA